MFRRFMIVCWGLFALAVFASASGWGIYKYSYAQIMHIRDYYSGVWQQQGRMETDSDWNDPATIEKRLKVMELLSYTHLKDFGFEEIPSENEVEDSDWRQIVDNNTGRTLREVVDDLESATKRLKAVQRYRDRQRLGVSALSIAGPSALVLLLWNIILQTGHWIWMGRKQ